METNEKSIYCNFCGVDAHDSHVQFFQGTNVYICEDCVKQCVESMENMAEEEVLNINKSMKPSAIIEHLNQYVVGQDEAKRTLAVAVYNHHKMIQYKERMHTDVEIEKSNICLLGPTGSGKTYILKAISKYLGVPFAMADATSLTESGYVGEDVETVVRKLIEAADGNVAKAEKGIIYIDEIDKIGRKGENVSTTKDVGGEGVQQAILKMVEGAIVEVPPHGGRKHPNQECIKVDTSNILFIIGGAFEGIEKIIQKRKTVKSTMGFGGEIHNKKERHINELIADVTVDDLKKFGMIPELLGRFPVITTLKELDEKELVRILTEPKNALIKQYQALFEMDGVKLTFEDDAVLAIASLAAERKTGARALRGIMEDILMPYSATIPDDKTIEEVIITADVVKNQKPAIIVHKETAC